MIATLHASQRLLERAFMMTEYTAKDIKRARIFLEADFYNVHTSTIDSRIALPSFPSMIAIIREGMIVTIKPKAKSPGMDEKKRKRLFDRNRR